MLVYLSKRQGKCLISRKMNVIQTGVVLGKVLEGGWSFVISSKHFGSILFRGSTASNKEYFRNFLL